MLKNKEEIKQWLDSMAIENHTINDDFTVDVDGSVDIYDKKLTNIPVQFGNILGHFNCGNNLLSNLEGSPKSVVISFYCHQNKLTDLEGCPESIGQNFICNNNLLTTLQGCPQFIDGNLMCANNPIKDLNDFNCNFSGIFYHKGTIIEEFSEFYIEGDLKLTYKDIENIKFNNRLNNIIKDKIQTINTISKNKL